MIRAWINSDMRQDQGDKSKKMEETVSRGETPKMRDGGVRLSDRARGREVGRGNKRFQWRRKRKSQKKSQITSNAETE